MNKEINEKYLEALEKIEYRDPLVKIVKNFVKTYDGSNKKEFKLLMLGIVGTLHRLEKLSLESEGYQATQLAYEEFKNQVDGLKKDFELLEKGKIPQDPPIPVRKSERSE